MSQHHYEYRQWPFLTEEEFELACAFFDQRYVQATLGPTRQNFKVSSPRTATTGISYIEILRLLRLPEDEDELSLALANLGKASGDFGSGDMVMDAMEEDHDEEALRLNQACVNTHNGNTPPGYSLHSQQPYVTYEIHLHPTYRVPSLWFILHDLPMGESAFDIDAVYRYLVPPEYKSKLRAAGVIGGISAAPHPITDVPAFFLHPCQTKEAMLNFDCSLRDYLMVWIGVVGGCLGLWVPSEMAQENRVEDTFSESVSKAAYISPGPPEHLAFV